MASLKGYADLHRRFVAIGKQGSVDMMRALGLAAVREQKLMVHRKTGNTGRTIRIQSVSATQVVTSAAGAAIFLEDGTKAHEITPKAKLALRFASTGAGRRLSGAPRAGAAVVFAKRVHHPGTKAYPFMLPGAQKALESAGILYQVIQRWNKAA